VKQALQSVVLLSLDAEKGEGIDLAKSRAVRAYPTFELVNAKGETIDRWVGYAKPMFLGVLAQAVRDQTPLEAKRERFTRAPSASDAAVLGRYHSSRYELNDAVRYFREAQRLNQDPSTNYAGDIFENVARGIPDTTFTMLDLKDAADLVLASATHSPRSLLELAGTTLRLAIGRGDPEFAAPYVNAALAETETSTDPEIRRYRNDLLADRALWIERDGDRAFALKREAMPAGWMERASDLNSIAWWCFEGRVHLPEAEELARKGVALAPAGKEKAMLLDTLAEILNARGNPKEAATCIRQAMQEAPDDKYYPKQLARFTAS
jgi:tetratricopeptide (TPR) repeat protein